MFCTIVFRGSVPALWLLTIAQSGRLGRRPRPTGSVTAYTENWIEMTGLFQTTLILAKFLCSLVAGFLFAFSVVVMPGIKSLIDRNYLHAFQVMDRIIQNNQPVFVLVWVGSAIMLIASVVLGIGQLDAIGRILVICTALIYLLGVQLPTIVINIPLNNKLQTLDIEAVTETACKAAREDFEPRWNRWNTIRAVYQAWYLHY